MLPGGTTYLPLILLLFSAMGGILYGVRQNRCIQIPALLSQRQFSLGFLGDMFFGIAGGTAIFLIVPFVPDAPQNPASPDGLKDTITSVKLFGVAFLGGWGGPTLLDFILQKTVLQEAIKKADEAKESATKVSEKLEKNEERIHDVRQQLSKDNHALSLIVKQISGPPDPPVPEDDLFAAIGETSFDARERIFREAKRTRLSEEVELDKAYSELKAAKPPADEKLAKINLEKHCDFMERIATIFRALAAAGKDDDISHLYHANLGYALMSLRDYKHSIESLSTAIKIRDETDAGDYPYYEFTRARARMFLSKPARDEVLIRAITEDLRRAGAHDETREAIRRDALVQGWLRAHSLQEADWLET